MYMYYISYTRGWHVLLPECSNKCKTHMIYFPKYTLQCRACTVCWLRNTNVYSGSEMVQHRFYQFSVTALLVESRSRWQIAKSWFLAPTSYLSSTDIFQFFLPLAICFCRSTSKVGFLQQYSLHWEILFFWPPYQPLNWSLSIFLADLVLSGSWVGWGTWLTLSGKLLWLYNFTY